MPELSNPFDLAGRVAVITGGAGLLGVQHARAIARAGGSPVLIDLSGDRARQQAVELAEEFRVPAMGLGRDITDAAAMSEARDEILAQLGRVDILINNAANNPKMEDSAEVNFSRFENFPLRQWQQDIDVGLTGAFLCAQVFGTYMASHGGGVILNIASDLALIGPDQRLYRQQGTPDHLQPVKPVTYSIVKSGLIGLTRYLATYWAESKVRVNSICPGGVENNQPDAFLEKLHALIPMGRMARVDEYQGAVLFLCSNASSYMTGANLVVDGGRTCW